MRSGGDYFTAPAEPAQRRYEAMRAYFVEELSATEVGKRFGYSPAVVHQMASELRAGKAQFFQSSKPGPKGARKTERIRDRVLELRARDRSVTEIAQAAGDTGQELLVGCSAHPVGVTGQVRGLRQRGEPEQQAERVVVGQRVGVRDARLARALGQQQRSERVPRGERLG